MAMNEEVTGFHEDLQSIIKGLDHPNRQEIIKTLRKNNRMSFSEIEKETHIKSSLLANHLSNLVENLIVDRFYDHISEKNAYSYYELTVVGKRIISALEAVFYGEVIKETPIVS
ncbi:MAG: winged helix-turn-helix domain-containing protein [Candidatus Bathyarchaeota archaeon]|nr:winged helix-turn-helix domain-containing protein [Candidatus Bathyarchaeota archaeon]